MVSPRKHASPATLWMFYPPAGSASKLGRFRDSFLGPTPTVVNRVLTTRLLIDDCFYYDKMRLEMLVGMQIEILNWWGDFIQLVKIEKLKFVAISRYKSELRFWLNLNSSVSRGTNSNLDLNLQLTKISRPFRISICIPTTISSLIFSATGCTWKSNLPWLEGNGTQIHVNFWVFAEIDPTTWGLTVPLSDQRARFTLSRSEGWEAD